MANQSGRQEMRRDTIPTIFWAGVLERGNKTAMREKKLGVWRSISWREYGSGPSGSDWA